MRGWIDLGSDVCWEDYGGMWGKRAPDGVWYVLKFENMIDCCGERDAAEMGFVYECDVKRVNLLEIPDEEIANVLKSCGWRFEGEDIISDSGDIVANRDSREAALVSECVSYGLGAPIKSFTSKVRPANVRANARRYAEECMRDAKLVAERLARPVNAIGSTAAEYGRGDINSALARGPATPTKQLMRKLYGLPPFPLKQ